VPLSVEVSVERVVGTCSCGTHGALTSTVVTCGSAVDRTKPSCSACQETEVQRLVLMTPESKVPRAPSRRVRKLSAKQEREVMADLGGRTQPASGSKAGYKGDGRVYNRIRVEMKETFGLAFNLTRGILDKIRGECTGREEPVVVIDYKDRISGRTEDRWCVIEYKVLSRILEATKEES
jgi:hypothetical protein